MIGSFGKGNFLNFIELSISKFVYPNMEDRETEIHFGYKIILKGELSDGGENILVRISIIVCSSITIVLASYGLITKNFEYQAYMVLFSSLLMLFLGIREFQQKRNGIAWLLIGACLFSLFASIQSFISL